MSAYKYKTGLVPGRLAQSASPLAWGRFSAMGGLSIQVEGAPSGVSDVGLAFQGRLMAEIEAAEDRLAKAYTGAAHKVADQGKAELREDILAGGFHNGAKLAKTWRANVYPRTGASMSPAIWFTTKAGVIVDAFAEGVTIRVNQAEFLALPLGPAKAIVRRMNREYAKGVGRSKWHAGGGQFARQGNPVERVERALNVDLIPVMDRTGTRGVLIALGRTVSRGGAKIGDAKLGRETPLFALVKQAKLKRRIRGRAVLNQIERTFPARFTAALAATLAPEDKD